MYIITGANYFDGDEQYTTLSDVEQAIQDAITDGTLSINEAENLEVSELVELSTSIEVSVSITVG